MRVRVRAGASELGLRLLRRPAPIPTTLGFSPTPTPPPTSSDPNHAPLQWECAVGMRDRRKIWQLSLRDEDELGEDIHVIARPHLARPSCSKSYACLFSSPQTSQTHHTPGDIKDPTRHQAVVNAHFHLLTEVAVVGTPSIPPLFPTPEAVKEVGSSCRVRELAHQGCQNLRPYFVHPL